MSRKLNVEGFINEMSYDLRMEELDKVVLKYQEPILEYIINFQFSYKERRRVNQLFEIIRSDKYLTSMEKLIEETDEVITDMAYVLVNSTYPSYVDKSLKQRTMQIAYQLRGEEVKETIKHDKLREIITTLSVWSIRGYEVSGFFRTKCLEKVIDFMPGALYYAFGDTIKPSTLNQKVLFLIMKSCVPDCKIGEVITSFFKSDYDYNDKSKFKGYASRLRAFLYELCAVADRETLNAALKNTCESMFRFNQRNNTNESFSSKYLNYNLLKKLGSGDDKLEINSSKRANDILRTYDVITRFIKQNPVYSELF